jgi:hypothetical protein
MHDKQLQSIFFFSDIMRFIKSRRIRWIEHAAWMENKKKIVINKLE